jgi:hypothetical protein
LTGVSKDLPSQLLRESYTDGEAARYAAAVRVLLSLLPMFGQSNRQ